jgi:hypothetical protein
MVWNGVMQTTETLFERELTKLIEERIQAVKDEMGLGLMSHERYLFAAGQIDGLKAAVDNMVVAREKSEQRNR